MRAPKAARRGVYEQSSGSRRVIDTAPFMTSEGQRARLPVPARHVGLVSSLPTCYAWLLTTAPIRSVWEQYQKWPTHDVMVDP